MSHVYYEASYIVLTIFNITDNLYVQAYHNKEARYNLHLGFCTIEFYCIVYLMYYNRINTSNNRCHIKQNM